MPLAGIEPALLAELDFESSASTNSATGASGHPLGREVAKPAEYSGRSVLVNPCVVITRSIGIGRSEYFWPAGRKIAGEMTSFYRISALEKQS